jgi:hypothetical protein
MPPSTREVVGELRGSTLTSVVNPRSLSLLLFGVIGFSLLILSPMLFETNSAGWYAVKQSAGSGTMTAHMKPGMFAQMFGDVTFYKAADTVHFGKDGRGPVGVRFNDGATSDVVANVRYELPNTPEKLVDIHGKFRSYDALVRETIEQVVREAVLLSAAMMSAEESYTTKRAEFSQLAQDQVINGVYLTEAETIEVKDKKTGESTPRTIVRIKLGKDGQPLRKEAILDDYGIRITQFVVQEIDYSDAVDGMIQSKQTALQQVVSAKAQAEKAVQDRLTAEEVGKKNVAVARYEQEVKKQTAVTEAEQRLEVAKLGRLTAEQEKAAKIAQAEGEGEYRRKIMVADGALQQKLDALKAINESWANALANSKNPIVPSVVMDGGGSAGGNGVQQFMQLLSAQAAKQLAVDLNAKTGQ